MTICKFCGQEIPDTTDDNYNTTHDKIKCPNCCNWQIIIEKNPFEDLEKNFDN